MLHIKLRVRKEVEARGHTLSPFKRIGEADWSRCLDCSGRLYIYDDGGVVKSQELDRLCTAQVTKGEAHE